MKNYKKVGMIFSAVIAAAVVFFGVAVPRHSLALANQQEAQQCANNLKFVDIAHISCTVNGSTTVFVDNNPTDSDVHYQTDGFEDESSSGAICQGKGEYLDNDDNKYHASDAGSTVMVQHVVLYYPTGGGQAGCTEYDQDNVSIKDTAGLKNELKGGDNSAVSFDDLGGGSSLDGHSYSRYPASGAYDNPDTGTALFGDNVDLNNCSGSILAVYYSGSSGATATEYEIGKSGDSLNSKKNLANLPTNTCGVSQVNFGISQDANIAIGIRGGVTGIVATQVGKSCDQTKTPPDGYTCSCPYEGSTQVCTLAASADDSVTAAATTANSCGVAGGDLTWLFCPVMDLANTTANFVTSAFEGQLSFKIEDLSSNGGADKTEQAWALFRDLASSLIVVVMLVMVFSQAMGGGPFDAYTVRKLLPKLVAAIILIQVSWYVIGWAVDVINDIGIGIKDLMYVPFQPAKLDDYWNLLANAGVGTGGAAALNWLLLIPLIGIAAVVALPLLLMFVFVAIMAVLTGLATLIFRQILIVLALMVAPIALVAWVLPGTQKYFKMWYDNLLKALFMFPIVMALIGAGRIFAYVVGTTGNNSFIKFFLVTVGFFGPLFILPKAFKWGGQAMSLAGNAAFKASTKLQERPNKYFKARQEDWSAARKAESQRRYGQQTPFNPRRFWQYPLDRLRAGEFDPLLGRAEWMPGVEGNARMRRRKMTGYKEAGLKHEDEDQAAADREAILDEKRLNELGYDQGGYNHDHYWQDRLRGDLDHYNNTEVGTAPDGTRETYRQRDERVWRVNHGGSLDGFTPGYRDYQGRMMPVRHLRPEEDDFERNAILNRIGELGADTNHQEVLRYAEQELASGDGHRISSMQKWMQDHKDLVLKNYPHLLKGTSSTADANDLSGVHGAGVADEMARLAWNINNSAPGSSAQRRAQYLLRKYTKTFIENAESPERRGSIEQGARRNFKALGTYDDGVRQAILERDPVTGAAGVNATRRERRYATLPDGTPIIDRQTHGRNLPEIQITPAVLAALEPDSSHGRTSESDRLGEENLRDALDRILDPSGAYRNAAGGNPPPPPGGGDDGPVLDVHPEDHGGGNDGGAERHYRSSQTSQYMDMPEGGTVRTHTPVSRPTQPSEFDTTEYGASSPSPAARASTTPSAASAGTAEPEAPDASPPASSSGDFSGGGSYEPTTTTPVSRVTERIIRETSPTTIIMPSSPNSVQTPVNNGANQTTPNNFVPAAPNTGAGGPIDRQTADELDYQLRRVYRELKRLGARDAQQQQQFEQMRAQHPEWDQDDDQNT